MQVFGAGVPSWGTRVSTIPGTQRSSLGTVARFAPMGARLVPDLAIVLSEDFGRVDLVSGGVVSDTDAGAAAGVGVWDLVGAGALDGRIGVLRGVIQDGAGILIGILIGTIHLVLGLTLTTRSIPRLLATVPMANSANRLPSAQTL
jgi:hypothetical protein